jgi:phospholipid/cholesterol/gamma-HCH transport system substrate-binding protein
LLAGKVKTLRVDPGDSTRIEIVFSVGRDIPVKTNSVAKITILSALGESYLEITTGTKDAPLARPGSVLQSYEMMALADLGDQIGNVVPTANVLMKNLNDRVGELQVTIARANDMLSDRNRKNLSDSLTSVNSMLAETRPKLAATLTNVESATNRLSPLLANAQMASEKITPLLDDLNKTMKQANDTMAHIDNIAVENRPEIRATVQSAQKTLETASFLVVLLKNTLDRNSEDMDDTVANLRVATGNMKDLTDTLKRKPSLLIRGEIGKDRQPGSMK